MCKLEDKIKHLNAYPPYNRGVDTSVGGVEQPEVNAYATEVLKLHLDSARKDCEQFSIENATQLSTILALRKLLEVHIKADAELAERLQGT